MTIDIVEKKGQKRMHPHKFTMWVTIGSIVMMFAGLTSAFIVKSNQTNFKLIGIPKVFWVSTVVIIASSLTLQWSLKSFRNREMKKYRTLIAVTAILGLLFVGLQWLGFNELWSQDITFKGGGAGQFLYVIFGLHAVHVIGGVIALLVIFIKAFTGRSKSYTTIPVEVASIYWHFVDILWVYLLVFFIIIGGN